MAANNLLLYIAIHNRTEWVANHYLLGLVNLAAWTADEFDRIAKMQVGDTLDFREWSIRREK